MLDYAVTLTAAGNATTDVAWQRYYSLDAWPDWSPQIVAVDAEPRTLTEGMTGNVVGPLGVTVHFTVLTVDQVARSWSWMVRKGPLRLILHHSVQPQEKGVGTTLRIEGFAPTVLAYAPLAQLALRNLVRA